MNMPQMQSEHGAECVQTNKHPNILLGSGTRCNSIAELDSNTFPVRILQVQRDDQYPAYTVVVSFLVVCSSPTILADLA